MAKINTHGLKIVGIKKASGNTGYWSPRSGGYTEIFYNRRTGEVWTVDQVSLGGNTWTEYRDSDIIKVGNTTTRLTMQQIADWIAEKLQEIEYYERENKRNGL